MLEQRNHYLGEPKLLPFLPFLPPLLAGCGPQIELDRSLSGTVLRDAGSAGDSCIQFAALADDSICLNCASPHNLSCGFSNWSLIMHATGDLTGPEAPKEQWALNLFTCPCVQCDQHAAQGTLASETTGDSHSQRILRRHEFWRLDDVLCVDDGVQKQRCLVPHQVPVIHLRITIEDALRTKTHARFHLDQRAEDVFSLYSNVFCSFSRTKFYLNTERGREALDRFVFDDAARLLSSLQLEINNDVLHNATSIGHINYCAMLLRVAVAGTLAFELQCDERSGYTSDAGVQLFVYRLTLFMDTHLDLALICEAFGICHDDQLTSPLSSRTIDTEFGKLLRDRKQGDSDLVSLALQMSPVERCYPHPLRAAAGGELGDMVSELPQSNMWSKARQNWSGAVSSLGHLLGGKALNHKCVAQGTLIAMADGTSRPIEELVDGPGAMRPVHVMSHSSEPNIGQSRVFVRPSTVTAGVRHGRKKECLRVVMSNGLHLTCTRDHKLRADDGSWVEAQNLVPGSTMLAVLPYRSVADLTAFSEQEMSYCYTFDSKRYIAPLTMTNELSRRRTLAFARILGFTIGRGWRAHQPIASHVFFSSSMGDKSAFMTDLDSVVGVKDDGVHMRDFGRFNIIGPTVRIMFDDVIENLSAMIGEFAPLSVVREFLAGLAGALSRVNSPIAHGAAQTLVFMEVDVPSTFLAAFRGTLECIKSMTLRFGVEFDVSGIFSRNRQCGRLAEGLSSVRAEIFAHETLLRFVRKIGVRYDSSLAIQLANVHANKRSQSFQAWVSTAPSASVVSVEAVGRRKVYDLEVAGDHAFFAGDIGVSNCLIRAFGKMASAEVGKNRLVGHTVLTMLKLSMLGNHQPGQVTRPNWSARLSVQRSFHWDKPAWHNWCSVCHREEQNFCPHCNEVPTKSSKEHPSHVCDECTYMARYKFIVFFAVKEQFVHQLHAGRAEHELLEHGSGWVAHERVLRCAMNDMREIIDRNLVAGVHSPDLMRKTLQECTHRLALAHDTAKPTVDRLVKSSRAYVQVRRMMNRIHKQLIAATWTGMQEPEDFLRAPLQPEELPSAEVFPDKPTKKTFVESFEVKPTLAQSPHAASFRFNKEEKMWTLKRTEHYTMAPERMRLTMCDVPLDHLDGKRWCEVYELSDVQAVARFSARKFGDMLVLLLPLVGISPQGFEVIRNFYFNSEYRDMPDNRVQKFLDERLLRFHPVDFHVLHYFLQCLHEELAVESRPLDNGQAKRQVQALRRRLHVDDWEPLNLDAGCVYVCRGQRHIFADVVTPVRLFERDEAIVQRDGSALELQQTVFSIGGGNSFYDHEKCGIVCNREKTEATRRMRRAGRLCAEFEFDAKTAKERRNARLAVRRCSGRVLERYSLVGRVLRVGKIMITLCVRCASICLFRNATLTSEGATCGREVRFAPANCFTELRQMQNANVHQLHTNRCDRTLKRLPDQFIMAPTATGTDADLFTRRSTPVIDLERCLESVPSKRSRTAMNEQSDAGEIPHSARGMTIRAHPQNSSCASDASTANGSYATSHHAKPSWFTETDEFWNSLSDYDKWHEWQPEGRAFREARRQLRFKFGPAQIDECDKAMRECDRNEARRREQTGDQYSRFITRAQNIDASEAYTHSQTTTALIGEIPRHCISKLREEFTAQGALRDRVEIVCVYCNSVCDPRGQFVCVSVLNSARVLIDPHTGVRLDNGGVVDVFMCSKCFDVARYFLAKLQSGVAPAVELAMYVWRVKRARMVRYSTSGYHSSLSRF